MRRVIVLTVLAFMLLSTGMASAQEYKQALRYQVMAGLVSSYITGSDYEDSGIGWGYEAGAGLFLPFFTKYFGVRVEAMYVNKQFTIQTTESLEDGTPGPLEEYNFAANFVEIPLLAELALTDNPDLRFYLIGGGAVGLRTSLNVTYTDENGQEQEFEPADTSTTQIQPIFGVGLRGGNFMMELRFNFGMSNFGGDNENIDLKINTNAFLIGLGF